MLPSVGIFGSDINAEILVSVFKAAGFSVRAVWGKTQESAKKIADELDIPYHTSKIQDLLLHNEVDIVCVSGSPHLYSEVCTKALSIGKHVFSSVPAGLTCKDAYNMLEKALYYPKLLSVLNHPLRFLNAYIEAKRLIKEGYCGDVLLAECSLHTNSLIGDKYDWRCDPAMGGGILQTYGSHIIDILTFLLDCKATEACGTTETFTKQSNKMSSFRYVSSDDFASFQLKYPDGVIANVILNSQMPSGLLQEVMIVGTKGFLKVMNCDLYGQLNNGSKMQCLYAENQGNRELYNTFKDVASGMYLLGLEQLIDVIKMAFQSMQIASDTGETTDRRNADHNLIASAANFENGRMCIT